MALVQVQTAVMLLLQYAQHWSALMASILPTQPTPRRLLAYVGQIARKGLHHSLPSLHQITRGVELEMKTGPVFLQVAIIPAVLSSLTSMGR